MHTPMNPSLDTAVNRFAAELARTPRRTPAQQRRAWEALLQRQADRSLDFTMLLTQAARGEPLDARCVRRVFKDSLQ